MKKRINSSIDLQILADLGMHTRTHKEIAAQYNVSPSYVSKLATGKKELDISFPLPAKLIQTSVNVNEASVKNIVEAVLSQRAFASDAELIAHLEHEITLNALRISVCAQMIKNIKGE